MNWLIAGILFAAAVVLFVFLLVRAPVADDYLLEISEDEYR